MKSYYLSLMNKLGFVSKGLLCLGRSCFVVRLNQDSNGLNALMLFSTCVNGDGLDDLIVGARYADLSGKSNAGKSYVVFGKD
jgi:hypothetical protein